MTRSLRISVPALPTPPVFEAPPTIVRPLIVAETFADALRDDVELTGVTDTGCAATTALATEVVGSP